ncbi:hypothetical protein HaLaN_13365 [Haematococcus lacustris]|uniref:Uncharacterized protein n=1 Tax=Haematococcus lacustris TaxID=44745 RepID=A0A699ZCC6_HAELA|nr:hypothetical protein HaLaN_13365 [Haematococcus lacustris]
MALADPAEAADIVTAFRAEPLIWLPLASCKAPAERREDVSRLQGSESEGRPQGWPAGGAGAGPGAAAARLGAFYACGQCVWLDPSGGLLEAAAGLAQGGGGDLPPPQPPTYPTRVLSPHYPSLHLFFTRQLGQQPLQGADLAGCAGAVHQQQLAQAMS